MRSMRMQAPIQLAPEARMRILFALTYYRPHISGLTIYVERLARALANRGHNVTVLTSRYDSRLPAQEWTGGVRIVRAPVALRVSKGVIMPGFGDIARALLREHDVASIHVPQFDAAGLAFSARFITRTPVVLTYHCDLKLPPGRLNAVAGRVVQIANRVALALADRVVSSTADYAEHVPALVRVRPKWAIIPPPIVVAPLDLANARAFEERWRMDEHRPTIGFVARFAAEKGVEVIVQAMPYILRAFPTARVVYAGPYRDVLGEQAYAQRLMPSITQLGEHWVFTDVLSDQDLLALYSTSDVVVLPSLNTTESFGMVQVEAMFLGTPVVASDLSGIRSAVQQTGMGELAAAGDAVAFAQAITRVLEARARYVRPRVEIEQHYHMDRTVDAYEQVFGDVVARRFRTT
jgi:glycosyltransferase involved in cell wall biosynthesis